MTMIGNIIANPAIYNITQNTAAQVGIETGLKAIGRPGFILLDNNIDAQTKKYSAMKEFLFQLTCLAVSFGVVIPVFKKGSFAIARKFAKEEKVFQAFNKSDEFVKYNKLSRADKVKKLEEINNAKGTDFKIEDINEDRANGVINVSSIAGSIIGLSALSPIVSRPFVRPVLKMFGMDQEKAENKPTESLDVNA